MELNLETALVFITIILTGLTAGLCFTWTNAVTPGIGQMDDGGFLLAFQQMNRSIINPAFIIVFFGPFISNLILVYLKYQSPDKSSWVFHGAAILFIVGVVLVTVLKNIPLNEILDKTDLALASTEELKVLRQKFENPWKQWHLVRTFSSIGSFVLLLIGLLLSNQTS
ncbi:anthrone oxygenase family protein [Winogradskyella sp. 3972H.M.0a.05]|uniref:anthrone oxygenase family protein n=1 Tax=Winogradskyella sp. 3972H.M.0a.05 TaxID=2950277 RepID=UPI0033945AA3